MKWFRVILVLFSYPIIELSRYIIEFDSFRPDVLFMHGYVELGLMWLAFIAGVILLAWRIK